MSPKIQAPRGTFDVLGDDALARAALEAHARRILERAGYARIETPTFEATELFARGVGESTDVVQKEMYTLDEGPSESLTLRPEGTAPVCRAYLEHGMHKLPQPVKLWYLSTFYRRERPQKGRYRQFWQVGAEAIGSDDPARRRRDRSCCSPSCSRRSARAGCGCGCRASARRRRARPTAASSRTTCARTRPSCPTRCATRIDLNPLRAFDADHPGTRRVMESAPLLLDHLTDEDRDHFAAVRELLDGAGVAYEVDPTLVRGLDYYTRTVFEFTSDALGAQSGVGGGGRYDGLIELIGGPPTPGMGWAAGVERILLASPPPPVAPPPLDLYVAYAAARVRGRRVPPRRRRAPRRPRRAPGARRALAQGPAQAGGPRRGPLRCDPGRGGDLPQGHGDRGAEDGGSRHGHASHPRWKPLVRPPRANAYRDAWAGELRAGDVDSTVRVAGWVHRRRDHGGLIFIDLRDRSGIVQLVFHPETAPEAHALAERLRSEHVVSATGTVVRREEGNVNPKLDTGEIELEVVEAETLAEALTPPFPVDEETPVDELLRLRHRVIDLRRAGMQRAMTIRHTVNRAIRDYLNAHDFLEIETPIMTRSTPEGARDFLVPSRLNPGAFYALPQSPQLFKQMLMMAGYERYYQIARCFRDEDLRADRQPEFTQLDLEMSFVDEDDVIETIEGMLARVYEATGFQVAAPPWPRMSYDEAMRALRLRPARRALRARDRRPRRGAGRDRVPRLRRRARAAAVSCAASTPARASCRARTSTG